MKGAICCAILAQLLSGCGAKPGEQAKAPVSIAKPATGETAVSVTTVAAVQRDLVVSLEAIGAVAPVMSVDVKPQLSTVITQVHVREGQFVKAGQLLFTLDSRADEANVAKLRAQVAKDEAALADAQRQLARNRELLAKNFVSQGSVDASQTLVDTQKAAVESDRAAVEAARVALSYGRVSAPSSGRAGAINVFPGSAVQANQTSMVTITQLDPIDVAFSLPQHLLNDVLAALRSGHVAVSASLPGGGKPLAGELQFVDNAVDPETGTLKVKARFDNRDTLLWPGASVSVAVTVNTIPNATVIPLAAIIQSARGQIVYIARDGKAALRPVKVLATQGEDAAVSGIAADDPVILDGRQNVRPDTAVTERSPEGKGEKGQDAGPEKSKDKGQGNYGEKASSPGSGEPAATKDKSTAS